MKMPVPVPEVESKHSQQIPLENNSQNYQDPANKTPDLIQSTKIAHFYGGMKANHPSTLQNTSTAPNQIANKFIEIKMNNPETSNYRLAQFSEHDSNMQQNKARYSDLQQSACCVIPKLRDLSLTGGLKNSCLSCKRAGCKENGEGSTCACQFPKRISFSSCSLNKSTSINGFGQSHINVQTEAQQHVPNNFGSEQANILNSQTNNADTEKDTRLENDEIINLLLNGLNAVGVALKLNNTGLNSNRYALKKMGLEAQKLIQNLIELQNDAKLGSNVNIPQQNDAYLNFNSNQMPPSCKQWPEPMPDHSCCNCNVPPYPVNAHLNNSNSYTTLDNMHYNSMRDNRMMPKTLNYAFPPPCQYHPFPWTVWPLFHSTAFL